MWPYSRVWISAGHPGQRRKASCKSNITECGTAYQDDARQRKADQNAAGSELRRMVRLSHGSMLQYQVARGSGEIVAAKRNVIRVQPAE